MIKDEVATSKIVGYNLGIKLIRGCYMVEERELAQEHGYESPIWDDIDQTHKCYNESMAHVIENIQDKGLMLIGSHNWDSIAIAK